ncbi:MAG: PEPxxWA-CTERM sorting domain-containing protein [Sphingomonadaceae bacterium]|nr:PEPxxWA-CTERM sorting domain-containing protein [Sphingomonadaceae bacterium]
MATLKEICALLLAGGVGAGSVVAVQEARPKPKVERKTPTARTAAAPRPVPPRTRIDDCPTLVAPLGGALVPPLADFMPPAQVMTARPPVALGGLLPPGAVVPSLTPGGSGGGGGGGGGGDGGGPPPPPAPIPEPAAWAMMVSGFGLMGVALRLRPRTTPQPA